MIFYSILCLFTGRIVLWGGKDKRYLESGTIWCMTAMPRDYLDVHEFFIIFSNRSFHCTDNSPFL